MNNIDNLDKFATNYSLINADKYPKESEKYIASEVNQLSNTQQLLLTDQLKLKDPTLALLLSFFFGTFAVDRFYLGNIMLGILKLITIGGCGIWTIIDWFIIMKSTRKQNLDKFVAFTNELP